MDPRQFDSLILQNQGFNTLNNVVHSNVVQNMAEQTLQSVHAMQGMQITQPRNLHTILPDYTELILSISHFSPIRANINSWLL